MNVELVTRREDLAELSQRWDELAQQDPRDGFFRTSAWYRSWVEHVRPDVQPFVIVVRDGAGEVVGLAPLCRLNYRDRWLPMKGVSLAGREVVSGDFLDYLSDAGARSEVLPAILNFLWQERSQWALLIVGEVTEDGDLHRAVESFAEAKGLALRRQEERVCPYIELPATYDQYLRGLSQKMRYEIRRDTRDVLEKWRARIEVCTEPGQVRDNLNLLIQLHTSHWKSVRKSGNMGRPGFPAFLRQVCSEPPPGAALRLYLLKLDEKPVAALLAFCFRENVLFYQTGWDPDSPIARLSPGMVLVARSIRDAIEQGYRYYDFLRGDETYKSRLTKSFRKTITLLVARSFSARQYLRVNRLKDWVKRTLLRRAVPAASEVAEPVRGSDNSVAVPSGKIDPPRKEAPLTKV